MYIKALKFIFISLLISNNSFADTPEPDLTADLKLDLPFIRFHPPAGNELFYWAKMHHSPNSDGRLLFEVSEYSLIPESEIPKQPELKPLEQVLTDNPPQISNLSGSEAQLIFTSAIPLACSVVYGPTKQFGSISVDPDMNGSAIIDHSPFLSGLQANTLYYYRVQGTTADGTVYWGNTETFITPSGNNTGPINLASVEAGARINAVSSNFGNGNNSSTWGADKAIDGSASSAWSSYGDGNDAYIEFTLAEPTLLDKIGVWSRSMPDGTAKIFSFTITTDNGTVLGPYTLPDTTKMYEFNANIETQTLRLDVVTSSGGNTGLVEFAAYPSDDFGM